MIYRFSICCGFRQEDLFLCVPYISLYMRGSRNFCPRGANFDNVFLVDEWWEDPNTTIIIIKMAFRWRADDDPTLNAGSIAM